jgi:hypothetical protein
VLSGGVDFFFLWWSSVVVLPGVSFCEYSYSRFLQYLGLSFSESSYHSFADDILGFADDNSSQNQPSAFMVYGVQCFWKCGLLAVSYNVEKIAILCILIRLLTELQSKNMLKLLLIF